MTKYDFSVAQSKKSAKQTLFLIGCTTLKACGVAEQISFLGFSYNVVNKLREEIGKLDEQTAEKALESIRNELQNVP